MNFEKDIFISYAHNDNEPDLNLESWVNEFHLALARLVKEKLNHEPVIWRDSELSKNDNFANVIADQFKKLRVMVSIVTPRYVVSDWCKRELDLFHTATTTTGGFFIENKSRLFTVMKTPVDKKELPESITKIETEAYEFFRIDKMTKRPREFNKLFGPELEQAFWLKIDDLAYDIVDIIKRMNRVENIGTVNVETEIEKPVVATSEKIITGRKIYLAETSYDLRDYYESLKRELTDKGHLVLPDKMLPPVGDLYLTEVEKMMKDCALSIHLIGSSYGTIPEKSTKSIIELQSEIATQLSSSNGLTRLVWLEPGADVSEEKLSNFINQLQSNDELHSNSDLLKCSIDDFKNTIQDNLRKLDERDKEIEKAKQLALEKSANKTTIESEDVPKSIYLICDVRDLDEITPVENYLIECGFETMLPVFEGDEAALRNEHNERLRICDAAILYYNNANDLWMRSMTRDLFKTPGMDRTKPLLDKMALVAGKTNIQKERFKYPNLTVVNALNGFDTQLLKEFISNLK